MKFIVDSDREHVKGAVREEHQYTHVRTFESFEEFDEQFGSHDGAWTSKGSNHRLVTPNPHSFNRRRSKQWIARDEPHMVRVVELSSLDELVEFIAFYGNVKVKQSDYADVPLALEFDDD